MIVQILDLTVSIDDAKRKFKYFISLPSLKIKEVSFSKAIDIAIKLKITLYDASYLVLAMETGTPLITIDEDLHKKGGSVAKVIHASEVTF